MRDFISKLRKRKKVYTRSAATDGSNALESCATIEDFTNQFFTTFPGCHLAVTDAQEFKNYLPTESLCTYLATLSKCMRFIFNEPHPFEKGYYSDAESRSSMDISKRMLIANSPYYNLIFSQCKGRTKAQNSDIANSIDSQKEPNIFALNIRYKPYMELQHFTYLQHIAYALRDTIRYCPYSTYMELPAHCQKANGTPDRRRKGKVPHDFDKYKNESGKFVLDLNKTTLPLPLNLFSSKVQKMLAMLGGPAMVEIFQHLNDVTYKNKNITSPKNITHFFTKIYEDYLNSYETDINKELLNTEKTLFNHFSFEAILNGSFLMYYCNLFSSQNRMVPTFQKLFPENDYLMFFSELYERMNLIENPFLKCDLLDRVIHPSFFRKYKYNNIMRSAGKENFSVWKNDVYQYITNLISMEKELYKKYISLTTTKIIEPETELLIERYSFLYNKCILSLSKKSKRGTRFSEILPKITLSNYSYYPIWPDF